MTAGAVGCSAWLGVVVFGFISVVVRRRRLWKYRHLDTCHREALLHSTLLGKASYAAVSCPPATCQKYPPDPSEKASPSILSGQTASGSCRNEGRSGATTSLSQILLGLGSCQLEKNVETPNDPKLTHGRGWRGPCAGEGGWGRRRWAAWAVTAAPVGCSAWLGVGVIGRRSFGSAPWRDKILND